MPLVSRCWVSLSLENVAEMTAAVRADDLGPLHTPTTVNVSRHGAGNGVVERRPSATALELLLRGVKRRVAAGAGVDTAGRRVLVVLAAEWGLGALLAEDAELL